MTQSCLIYTRPWNADQFRHLATAAWPDAQITAVSEHADVDDSGFVESFYANMKQHSACGAASTLESSQLDDVILRCRLLRALPVTQAEAMVYAAESAIRAILAREAPDVILSITVDSYILHLLELISGELDIPFVGLVPSFVNGYFRVTTRGEKSGNRTVAQAEIDEVHAMLLGRDYKPGFLTKHPKAITARARRLWLRTLIKPVWFRLKRLISSDPLNYHFYSTQIVSQAYWSIPARKYIAFTDYRAVLTKQKSAGRRVIFLPLQMSPEATVDYWSTDPRWVEYEARVLEVLSNHGSDVHFLIKEHPNILGMRGVGFYKTLEKSLACTLVPIEEDSNAILAACDGVLICTGTVGFEAALRGIPVYSDTIPFHLSSDDILPISDLGTGPNARVQISKKDQNRLVKNLLEGLLQGQFRNDGSWDINDAQHKADSVAMAGKLNEFLTQRTATNV